jgi:glycosyltransferase involved in cell wall biosynthesis
VIAAFNEENTIARAVTEARKFGEVIVVDDGSSDATGKLARGAGARVISLGRNLGYSAAIREGYRKADREVVALLDADLQQVPAEIPRLVEPILDGRADMVIGSKFLGNVEYKPNIPNLVMDRLVATVLRLRFGVKLTNAYSGFRAMRRSCINFAWLKGNRQTGMLELDFGFASRYRVLEVPRTARKRAFGVSSVRWIDGLIIAARMMKLLVTMN